MTVIVSDMRPLPICQDVDYFVGRMALLEKDSQKRKKITDLELTESEWNRVKLLLDLLSVSRCIIRSLDRY